jgi:hypothetical protein
MLRRLVFAVLLASVALELITGLGQWPVLPWKTFCLITLWLFCGWLWLRQREAAKMESVPARPQTQVA